ncbi:hypothetical protein QK285_17710, partial [Pseudarthrobacter sp. AL20]|nr:hypothetical protein [Pseudarthrobacter sp. AL20]
DHLLAISIIAVFHSFDIQAGPLLPALVAAALLVGRIRQYRTVPCKPKKPSMQTETASRTSNAPSTLQSLRRRNWAGVWPKSIRRRQCCCMGTREPLEGFELLFAYNGT